jgi:hypothetical protein
MAGAHVKIMNSAVAKKHNWTLDTVLDSNGKLVPKIHHRPRPDGLFDKMHKHTCLICGEVFYTPTPSYQQPPHFGCQ